MPLVRLVPGLLGDPPPVLAAGTPEAPDAGDVGPASWSVDGSPPRVGWVGPAEMLDGGGGSAGSPAVRRPSDVGASSSPCFCAAITTQSEGVPVATPAGAS